MEKDQNINTESQDNMSKDVSREVKDNASENVDEIKEVSPEEKILELEDKVARTFAEMENQRRWFEKEREEAFSYGGFAFAKETLNLIDNLERSKQILENDEALKNSEALKKNFRTFWHYKQRYDFYFIKKWYYFLRFYW